MRASSARPTPGSGQGAATAAEALDQGSAGSAPRPRPCQRLGTHSRRSTSKHRDRRSGRGGRAVRPRESYVRTPRRFIGRRRWRPHEPPRSTGAGCQQPGVVVEDPMVVCQPAAVWFPISSPREGHTPAPRCASRSPWPGPRRTAGRSAAAALRRPCPARTSPPHREHDTRHGVYCSHTGIRPHGRCRHNPRRSHGHTAAGHRTSAAAARRDRQPPAPSGPKR